MRAVFHDYLDRSNGDDDAVIFPTPTLRDLLGR